MAGALIRLSPNLVIVGFERRKRVDRWQLIQREQRRFSYLDSIQERTMRRSHPRIEFRCAIFVGRCKSAEKIRTHRWPWCRFRFRQLVLVSAPDFPSSFVSPCRSACAGSNFGCRYQLRCRIPRPVGPSRNQAIVSQPSGYSITVVFDQLAESAIRRFNFARGTQRLRSGIHSSGITM